MGRGGQKGTYAGRGMKGQKSRSGYSRRPTFEGGRSSLIARTKKVRGFKSNKTPVQVVNFSDLEERYSAGEVVSPETLKEKGLIRKTTQPVKILGKGDLKKKLEFKDVAVSNAAQKRMEK